MMFFDLNESNYNNINLNNKYRLFDINKKKIIQSLIVQ